MSVKLRFFNTLSRTIEDFQPIVPGKVGIYTCGPTVYSYAHIGNMRSFIFADILRRAFEYFNWDINHVMNITDVGHLTDDADAGEDKLELGARREGLDAWAVARKYTDSFFEHAAKLNIKKPSVICKATDHIAEQIELIQALERNGFVYRADDALYFDTSKFSDYPKLGRLDIEGLRQGHRVEVGGKHEKTDFALWKFSKPEDKRAMEWDSPWGRGFPGWHIECSAMAMKYLGEQFDVHTGGVDHIPIHHTNEVAQSECATGHSPFVRYWMHGEFLVMEDAEKMSKSLGNFITVSTLEEKGFDPLSFRILCLQTHYRKQLRFSYDNMLGAQKCYERLSAQAIKISKQVGLQTAAISLSDEGQKYKEAFEAALSNDLNMPQAFANLFAIVDDSKLSAAEKKYLIDLHELVFGLDLYEGPRSREEAPAELLEMLAARNQARANKDWQEADRLRSAIIAAGYEILDAAAGSSLKKKV